MKTRLRFSLALALPAALTVSACGDDDDDTPDMGTMDMGAPPQNIVATAQTAGLEALVNAVNTAGLDGTLTGAGPFTVFAPTNAAFAALGDAAPSDPDLLANVLLHHVVSGENDASVVTATTGFTTLAKTFIAVNTSSTPATIGGAPLSSTLDVQASNGIVHVIDAVMLPPTIVGAVMATNELSELLAAVTASSTTTQAALAGGPITVFAPVNSAFQGTNLTGEDLDAVLSYHVVPGQVLSSQLMNDQMVTTAGGGTFTVNISGEMVTITDGRGNTAQVIETDIRLLNGTVHLIDGVLLPQR